MLGLYDHILAATGGPTHQDGLLSYFLANGAVSNNIVDAEYEFLIAGGASPSSIPDMWYEFLTIQGYTGSVPDMYYDYWAGTIPPPPLYAPNIVMTTATSALSRGSDLSGNFDSKRGLVSCWIDFRDSIGADEILYRSQGFRTYFGRTIAGTILFETRDTLGNFNLRMESTIIINSSPVYHHILISYDLSIAKAMMYIDGVSVANASILTDSNVDNSRNDHFLMSSVNSCTFDIYINLLEYLDIDIEANRLLFRDSLGNPVDLGATGSIPTGGSPIIFLNNNFGDFEINKGYGGDFMQSGPLMACMPVPPTFPLNQEQIVVPSDITSFDYISDAQTSFDGNRSVVGAPTGEAAWAYDKDVSGNFVNEQKLLPPDAVANDRFGIKTAMSSDGTVIAVAAHRQNSTNSNGGAVYIWELITGTWTYKFKVIPNGGTESNARFGFSISLSGDGATLLVGEPFRNAGGSNRGAAYVFDISGGASSQLITLISSVTTDDDDFGYDVHLSDDGLSAFVGAQVVGSTGAVFVYDGNGGWIAPLETQIITASDGAAADFFGAPGGLNSAPLIDFGGECISSSADGTRLFIGAYGRDGVGANRGAVYYFTGSPSAGTMTEQQIITATTNPQDNSVFGYAVSCDGSGNKLVIGAQSNNINGSGTGLIYLYEFTASFTETYQRSSDSPQLSEFLGYAVHVSLDGNSCVVIASDYDGGATDTGAMYSFSIN